MHILNNPRIAEKIGFSCALNPNTISAYHDAAKYIFPKERQGRNVRRAFMRGWKNGYVTLHKVKQDITAGLLVFVRDGGEYADLLSGNSLLTSMIIPD